MFFCWWKNKDASIFRGWSKNIKTFHMHCASSSMCKIAVSADKNCENEIFSYLCDSELQKPESTESMLYGLFVSWEHSILSQLEKSGRIMKEK